MRLGPGELLDVQTPLSTSASVPVLSRVSLAPFRFGGTAMVEPRREASVQTDLEVLVAAAAEAHRQGGGARPRRPWLEMVESVEFCDVVSDPPGDGAIPLAMADDPDRQRHTVTSWNPAEGHLALLGAVGSGRSPGLRLRGRREVDPAAVRPDD